MPTYPSLTQNVSSDETQLLGRQIDRATNGAVRGRVLFTAVKKVFSVHHAYLTAAEKATLEAFYTTNFASSFDFLWTGDNVTYTVIFGEDDLKFTPAGGEVWETTVQLLQV